MQKLLRPVFCLLIEDNPLVGLDLADALDAGGYYVAGPFPCGREACEWLARFTPDVAVVDLTLRDGRCLELVRELRARTIPFIIYSGCPIQQRPSDVPADVPWLEKPASYEVIAKNLELLSARTGEVARTPTEAQQTNHADRERSEIGPESTQELAHG
ncbi:response regulator [Microvirga yunnanensis]|uniref:response regulator n=1 Tax=Microvirga yunnanensis TaxID=2953740 RepID=UPI0035A0A4BA